MGRDTGFRRVWARDPEVEGTWSTVGLPPRPCFSFDSFVSWCDVFIHFRKQKGDRYTAVFLLDRMEESETHTASPVEKRSPGAAGRPRQRSELRDAIRNTILAQATGLILPQVLFQGGVISLLILALGGSELEIGAVFTIYNLCGIAQLFTAPYVDVRSRKRILMRALFSGTSAITLIFLVYPLSRLVGGQVALLFLAAVVLAYSVAVNVATTAWFPLLTDIIPARIRGRFFGSMRAIWQTTSFLVTLLSGWLLGSNTSVGRFYFVFLLGIGFHFARLNFVRKLPDPPPPRKGKPESLFRNLKRPLRDQQFRPFIVFVLFVFGLNAAALPFVMPYLKVDLGFPSSVSVYATACIAFGSILSLRRWGSLADRWGNRAVFLLSLLITSVSFVIFSHVPEYRPGPEPAFLAAALGFALQGIGTSGLGIAHTVRMMFEAPDEHRGPYMAIVGVSIAIATGTGPLLSGVLLEHLPVALPVFGNEIITKRLFFLAVVPLILSTLLLLRRLRPIAEPRTQEILRSLVYILPTRVGSQLFTLGRLVRRRNMRKMWNSIGIGRGRSEPGRRLPE